MQTIADERIYMDMRKREVTIIRTPENLTSYLLIESKKKLDPYTDFEFIVQIPSDSAIVSGDLLLCESDYYLVMALEERWERGQVEFYKGTLYKCNSVISVYYFNESTGRSDIVHTSGIHCLITQVNAQKWDEDKAIALKQYSGKQTPFQLYVQSSAGITRGINAIKVVDQGNRRFRVSKEFDVFIADNICQCQVLWEN